MTFNYVTKQNPDEDALWRNDIAPFFKDLPKNVRQVCQYAFTELVNNIIDHSGSEQFDIAVSTEEQIEIQIRDYGVGIFFKIKNAFALDDIRYAILEMAKGKCTTDPQRHSGEGVFFSSRMFDSFLIHSGNILFSSLDYGKTVIQDIIPDTITGTLITMTINKNSSVSIVDIFNEYADVDKQPGFYKTIVPLTLLKYEDEYLLSRSQAKRLLNRFDSFLEIILDFTDIDFIGQAFADEIFRVFVKMHPDIKLSSVHCNDNIQKMIGCVSK
jgi:anti-sigma regulatory factor (Ser/Thr protein kinase)